MVAPGTNPGGRRRGQLHGLLGVVLAGSCLAAAVALDTAWRRAAGEQLQRTADAAALAAAASLGEPLPDMQQRAAVLVQRNPVLGHSARLEPADLRVGHWNSATNQLEPVEPGREADADAVELRLRMGGAYGSLAELTGVEALAPSRRAVAGLPAGQAGGCGILAEKSLRIAGDRRVDTYDSRDGPYKRPGATGRLNLCSNGELHLEGPVYVHGGVHAGARGGLVRDPAATVTGSDHALGSYLRLPEARTGRTGSGAGSYDGSYDNGGRTSGDDNWRLPHGVVRGGVLVLSGDERLVLPSGRYELAGLEVSDRATLVVEGPTELVLHGPARIGGLGIENAAQDPSLLRVVSDSSAEIVFTATGPFHGSILAPYTEGLHITGHAPLFGSFVAWRIALEGRGDVHLDQALISRHQRPPRSSVRLLR